MTKEEIRDFIRESVDWLISEDIGCCTLPLDDRLAICVGWLPGYGEEERDDCIQSKDDPDFAINAGIKVYTSDDMRTDYEFINMPYRDNGDVLQTDVSIEPNEDYDALAEYFLKEYESMKDLNMDEDGRIIEDNFEDSYEKVEEESLEEAKDNSEVYTKAAGFARAIAKAMNDFSEFWMNNREVLDEDKIVKNYPNNWKSLDEEALAVQEWADTFEEFAEGKVKESLEEDKKKSHYEEIEFFPGDEGDLDAEDYIEENGLENVAYEWDDYRKGYVLYKESLKDEIQKTKKESLHEDNNCANTLYYLFDFYPNSFAKVLCVKYSDTASKLIDIAKKEEPMSKYFGNDKVKESCDKKSLKETWDGESIIEDLADRAKGIMNEGSDLEDAITQAIDEGLFYTKDIHALLQHYGSIDDVDIVNSYYDELYSDIYSKVEDYIADEEESDEDDFEDDEEETNESLHESVEGLSLENPQLVDWKTYYLNQVCDGDEELYQSDYEGSLEDEDEICQAIFDLDLNGKKIGEIGAYLFDGQGLFYEIGLTNVEDELESILEDESLGITDTDIGINVYGWLPGEEDFEEFKVYSSEEEFRNFLQPYVDKLAKLLVK